MPGGLVDTPPREIPKFQDTVGQVQNSQGATTWDA